jgi:hypothetical protein
MWTEVRLAIGNRTDIDTEIKRAVNDATIDVVLQFRVRQMIQKASFTTSYDTSVYSLDANCLDVIDVRNDTDAVMLEKGDYLSYASTNFEDTNSLGTPSMWVVDGTSLALFNSPPDDTDFDITYRYLRRPALMSADANIFPLPREWERPTKLFAKSYVFELLGQAEKAMAAHAQGTAIARSRKGEAAWGELHRGDNRIDLGQYSDEGF